MVFKVPTKRLNELSDGREIVEIEVRVIRKWKNEIISSPGHYYIDLILLDDENVSIQATINKNIWKRYDAGVVEGSAYTISRFIVCANVGFQDIATSHAKRIWFDYATKVTTVETSTIPMNKFSFNSFNDILHLNVDRHHFTDIVGEFANYHPIHTTKNNQEWTIIDLIDIEGTRLSCSIWSPYITQVIQIINDYMGSANRPILVLQYVKPSVFNDNVTATTTRGATRILVNPDLPEVAAFRARSDAGDGGGSQLTELTAAHSLLAQKKSIKSLEQINNGGKAGEFVTKVTIVNIDSNVPWYYYSCNLKKCRSKAILENDGFWYCTSKNNCMYKTEGARRALPRFQVKFHVIGGENVSAEFMMFDNHINTLVKESAAYLVAKQEKKGKEVEDLTGSSEVIANDSDSSLKFSTPPSTLRKRSYAEAVCPITNDMYEPPSPPDVQSCVKPTSIKIEKN